MANTFQQLPTNAAPGPGNAVDVSGMGAAKTITMRGDGQVLIEYSNDPAALLWNPLVQFTQGGYKSVQVACNYLRANVVTNTSGVAPSVNVAAQEGTVTITEIVAPADNGQGDAVDTSEHPPFQTIQVSGEFKGVLNVEISCDNGDTFSTVASFQGNGGSWYGTFTSQQMRVSRSGVRGPGAPGLPTIRVGSSDTPGSGGGGGGVITDGVTIQGDGTGGAPVALLQVITDGSTITGTGIPGDPLVAAGGGGGGGFGAWEVTGVGVGIVNGVQVTRDTVTALNPATSGSGTNGFFYAGPTNPVEGDVLHIVNVSTVDTCVLAHDDPALPTPELRIWCPNKVDFVLPPGAGCTLCYAGDIEVGQQFRWYILSLPAPV